MVSGVFCTPIDVVLTQVFLSQGGLIKVYIDAIAATYEQTPGLLALFKYRSSCFRGLGLSC